MNNISMFAEYPDVVGIKELCEMLDGISSKLAYRLLHEKRIPCIRIGREYKIAKADVIEFLLMHKSEKDGIE